MLLFFNVSKLKSVAKLNSSRLRKIRKNLRFFKILKIPKMRILARNVLDDDARTG